MQSDSIKLYAATLVAVVLSIGGPLLLVYIAMQPAIEGKDGLMALIAGFVGLAVSYLFTQNTATAAVRAYQSGVRSAEPPTG